MLQNFYQHPKKWSFLLNTYVLHTLIGRQQTANNLHTHCILERSGRATSRIFVPYAHKWGNMSDAEFDTFKQFDHVTDVLQHPPKDNVITTIYLRTPPEICLQRIYMRGKDSTETGSKNCSVGWLTELHNMHDDWLLPAEPIILQGDQSLTALLQELSKTVIGLLLPSPHAEK